jgi:hypothetical protein
VDPEIEIL